MIDKRVIAVIVIFILGGLFIYSFANPLSDSEEKTTDNGGVVIPSEKDPDKEEKPSVVNKESLNSVKSQLESLNKDDYTEESWELIQNLIKGAEESTTQEEFDLIFSQIDLGSLAQKPIDNPVQITNPNGGSSSAARPSSPNTGTSTPSGGGSNTSTPKPVEIDKTALNNIKAQLAKLNKNDYTTESWNIVQAQVKVAELQTTQAGFNEAVSQINLGLLQKKPTTPEQPKPVEINKTALNNIKNQLAGLNKNNYTEESWNAIQNQIAVAEKQTTQEAFDREVAKIDLNSLQVKPIDKAKLNVIKNQLAQLKQNNYTPASWQAIQNQIAVADAQPTQEKFDAEVAKINLNTLQLRATTTQIGVSLDKMGDSANIKVVKVNDNYIRYTGEMNTNTLTTEDGTTIRDFIVMRITSPEALSQTEKNNIQMVYEGMTIDASEFKTDVNNHSYVEIYQPFSRANDGSGSKDNLTTVSFTINWGYGETTQYTVTIDVTVN